MQNKQANAREAHKPAPSSPSEMITKLKGQKKHKDTAQGGERGGSVVECRTPKREVRGSKPTAAVLCP